MRREAPETRRITRVGGDHEGGAGSGAEGGASVLLRFLLETTAASLGLLPIPTFPAQAVSEIAGGGGW